MSQNPLLNRQIQVAYQLAQVRSRQGYLPYLESVVIDAAPEPLPFRTGAYPWQWEDAKLLGPALESITWHKRDYTGPRNFWFTRPRGHDKTTSLARAGLWLLAFSKRRITWVHAAADADQAALLTSAMSRQLELNPWLRTKVGISGRKASGARGDLEIVTSDAASAFGWLPDLISVDELTWWKKPSQTGPQGGLWGALWSARNKRPHCVVWVITNAGVKGSWQHDLLEKVRVSPRWIVHDEPGRLPTWMSDADIEADRVLLPPALARRVFDNVWVDPGEESGYLSRAEVQACEQLGKELGLVYRTRGEPGVEYVLSVDYGPKKDRTVMTVLHQEPSGLAVVDRLDYLQGTPEAPVPIRDVRLWIEQQREAFKNVRLILDPYQLLELAQYYEHHIPTRTFEARGGKSNYEMAELLRTCIINRRVAWYPGTGVIPVEGKQDTLADELTGLVLRVMPYGYRFDHEAGMHDDRAVSLGMGLVEIFNRPAPSFFKKPPVLQQKERSPLKLNLPRGNTRGLYGIS